MRALHAATGLSYLTAGADHRQPCSALRSRSCCGGCCRSVFDAAAADRATALVCFFPGFFVFGLLYSEPLSLTLTVICLIALLRRWWWVAGAAAGLASAARPNAAVLVIVCAWAAVVAIQRRREWMALVAPLLAPAGVLAQFTFLYFRTGHFLAYETVQEQGWHLQLRPQEPLRPGQSVCAASVSPVGCDLAGVLGAIFIVVAGVLLIRSGLSGVLVVYGVALGALDLFLVPDAALRADRLPVDRGGGAAVEGRLVLAGAGDLGGRIGRAARPHVADEGDAVTGADGLRPAGPTLTHPVTT